jgi:hypothetical protein
MSWFYIVDPRNKTTEGDPDKVHYGYTKTL